MTKAKSSEERREATVFKKADELSILCGIEVCLISYGVNGEIKTFPKDQNRVADIARRFTQLSETSRFKKSTSLEDALENIELQKMKMKKKEVDPNLGSQYDSYSLDQLKLAVDSIRRKFRSIHEYRENKKKKKKKKKIEHGNDASSSSNFIKDQALDSSYLNSFSEEDIKKQDLEFQCNNKKKKKKSILQEANQFLKPDLGYDQNIPVIDVNEPVIDLS